MGAPLHLGSQMTIQGSFWNHGLLLLLLFFQVPISTTTFLFFPPTSRQLIGLSLSSLSSSKVKKMEVKNQRHWCDVVVGEMKSDEDTPTLSKEPQTKCVSNVYPRWGSFGQNFFTQPTLPPPTHQPTSGSFDQYSQQDLSQLMLTIVLNQKMEVLRCVTAHNSRLGAKSFLPKQVLCYPIFDDFELIFSMHLSNNQSENVEQFGFSLS